MNSIFVLENNRLYPESTRNLIAIEESIRDLVASTPLFTETPPSEFKSLVQSLHEDDCCIDVSDRRIEALWKMSYKAHQQGVVIKPTGEEDHEDIYFLTERDNSTPFAVFKPGNYRANMESTCMGLADALGLEDHFVTGRFAFLRLPPGSQACVRLWNGCVANYSENKKKPLNMVGFLEEYLPTVPITPTPLIDFSKMILFLIAAGVRDVKLDGIRGTTVFDADDVFSSTNDPKGIDHADDVAQELSNQSCRTDWPFLDSSWASSLIQTPLKQEELESIRKIISQWCIEKLQGFLENRSRVCVDPKIENIAPPKTKGEETLGEDLYGASVAISITELLQTNPEGLSLEKESSLVLTKTSRDATLARIWHIHDFFTSACEGKTLLELVKYVDPFFAMLLRHVYENRGADPTERLLFSHTEGSRGITNLTPTHLIGRCSLTTLTPSNPLSKEDIEALRVTLFSPPRQRLGSVGGVGASPFSPEAVPVQDEQPLSGTSFNFSDKPPPL